MSTHLFDAVYETKDRGVRLYYKGTQETPLGTPVMVDLIFKNYKQAEDYAPTYAAAQEGKEGYKVKTFEVTI